MTYRKIASFLLLIRYRQLILSSELLLTTCASSLLAIYTIIYATCVGVLIRRKREGYMWHLVSSTILFLLASVQVTLLVAMLMKAMNYGNTFWKLNGFGDAEESQRALGLRLEALKSIQAMQMAFNTTILLSL